MNEKLKNWRKKLTRLLLELFILVAVLLAAEAWLTRDAVSGKALAFAAQTLTGESFELTTLRGEPALVHFWATWCPVCGLEQGMIDNIADDHPFISVAMQSGDAKEVVAYMTEQGVNYPVVNDPDGVVSRRYGVSGVPATFVLNSEGGVAFVTHGYTSSWGLRARLWLADLI